ncbi:hypothetical protein MiSe_90420 [Microseira wollei NIES-4236]|uniref:Uncharacterized protein n=1 Tax=Microseira wollei NIES-4236 TaxID=2530354 RepID=A0AAV3XSS7_9CYAN|nr:hypothetical protein MiSe_90420 [Microseira wollei NIES-4236]
MKLATFLTTKLLDLLGNFGGSGGELEIFWKSTENQETPPTNPEPNLTLPINPSWADTDVITV